MHPGFIYSIPVEIFVVEGGAARKIAYDPALFNFGNVPAARGGDGARVRRLPRADRAQPARRAAALRDLCRRELLQGGLQGPGLRPERPGARHRHRRGGGRGVPLLPRPLARDARRGPHGGALAPRRPERRRRLPLHHPPGRSDADRRRGDDLRPRGHRASRPRAADLDVPLRRQGPRRARRLPPRRARFGRARHVERLGRAAVAAAALAAAAADQRLRRFGAARLRADPARAELHRTTRT